MSSDDSSATPPATPPLFDEPAHTHRLSSSQVPRSRPQHRIVAGALDPFASHVCGPTSRSLLHPLRAVESMKAFLHNLTPAASSPSSSIVSNAKLSSGSCVLSMDWVEKMRRWKRSLDGFISFRKAVLLAFAIFVFLLYVGPTLFGWIFGRTYTKFDPTYHSCIDDKLLVYSEDLRHFNAHSLHSPWRPLSNHNYLPYVGNGHIGLPTDPSSPDGGLLHIFGGQRHLNVRVPFKPLVQLSQDSSTTFGREETASIVHYTSGLVHSVRCTDVPSEGQWLSVSSVVYAHRAIKAILVQEMKVVNPTSDLVRLGVERLGILDWKGAESKVKTIEHGDGNQKYIVVSGLVPLPLNPSLSKHVVVVMKKLTPSLEVGARMTETLSVFTSVAYSEEAVDKLTKEMQEKLEQEAIDSLLKAVSMTSTTLRQLHLDIWRELWTTGFGISHSMAENAVNELQINATMYYVLSQAPAPIHSAQITEGAKAELLAQLAYSEGCYGGNPTLLASTLWRTLATLEDVNTVVKTWMVTLDKNGCQKLLKAGADGVIQAMVLSFAALKFQQDHLELNSHPKDLHRDLYLRRVSYGNATHLNISIVVGSDNKPVIYVGLDRKNKDYFACDAGCLDPPVKLTTEAKAFPVKLTNPVTAILYITSDHEHMHELKEAIHFKDVAEAPAHEHHVIALHRHGNKLGGLPTIFWFSLGFLILVFHLFLVKLIWQEYCAGQDKFRSR